MSATAGQAQGERGLAERLGLKPGQVVQEIGWDEDVDEELRDSIESSPVTSWWTRTTTTSSTWCCCGGATATATSSTP